MASLQKARTDPGGEGRPRAIFTVRSLLIFAVAFAVAVLVAAVATIQLWTSLNTKLGVGGGLAVACSGGIAAWCLAFLSIVRILDTLVR